MTTIYVLELESNKYYVGKSKELEIRLENHFNNNGFSWTQKYKPIKILEIFKDCDDFDEDKYTLKYMSKYGINNVRGGSSL
jgi:predicted GIY-YIG superfamily endonuclease